ncbi:MAG: autotransporter-associated beta strand repeat-containing protein, partial [Alphaproteobacteria bacterium]
MRGNISLRAVLVFSVAILGLSAGMAWSAETFIWTQVATDGLWSDTGNWDANGPASGDGNTADFSTLDIGAHNTVHLDAPVTIGNLIFDDNNRNWILDNDANAANILTLAGTTPTIEVIRRQTTISAVVAGTSGLTKAGSGTLWLNNNNTYTGGTVINGGGQVRIDSDAGFGDTSGAVTVNNSFTLYSSSNITLERDFALGSGTIMSFDIGSNNQDRTIAGAVTGEGGIYVTATLGLKLTSTGNTFTGPVSMGSGMFAGRFDVNSIGDAPGAGTIQIGSANGYGAGRFEYMSGAITPLVLDYRQIDVASPRGAAYLINNAGDANTITV